ncbi:response regulator [Geobacter argillaceus]|uniref:Response regulator receiver domain-containing protein n=1 Tax=Geobacter argillaceus TaxID=345631 RepID=A0A562WRA3_9BACT|nr:response regulator [Geobacter argillaceus]TWJ32685.1 response regulator receiver domain-containing protein [Geobacter argillaceus]
MTESTPAIGNGSPKPKVMLVDDEECIRNLVCDLLTANGIDVLTADGADACLHHLRNGFRGVILMDLMMPDKTGWETIREIKRAGLLHGNVIAMLTAVDIPDEGMDGLQEIVIDYITKPFIPDEFLAAVKRYLGYLDEAARYGE